jgi:hypothetical protein
MGAATGALGGATAAEAALALGEGGGSFPDGIEHASTPLFPAQPAAKTRTIATAIGLTIRFS